MYTQYKGDNLSVDYHSAIFDNESSNQIFDYLENNMKWKIPHLRSTLIYGDQNQIYTVSYKSEIDSRPSNEWDPILSGIKELVESITNIKYNICILQRYPSGRIGIGPHRDREVPGGSTIAGVSFGVTRKIKFQRWNHNELEIPLISGSLYAMNPPTNDYWFHSIEKDFDVNSSRISLTFRNM